MSDGLDWFLDLSGESAVALPTSVPPAPEEPQRSGRRLADRFELLEQLGEGGMGVVYHAREIASGRSVAIKLLRGAMTTATQKERFRREGIVTAGIRHPGIVSVHGAGAVDGSPYLVYEYVPGGETFMNLLEDGTPRDELLAALRDAAEALGAAHAQGVVHRDVKPGNLLVTPEGQVRVADFGLVRAAGLEDLTQTGQIVGTPLYMPFEQFDGNRSEMGPTADVWALGVILHQVITGKTPFETSNMVELIGAVQHTPVDPRRFVPSIEPALVAICKRALQRQPSKRYPDGAAFAADLTRFLAGEPLLGAPTQRGWGVAVALLIAVFVALAALLVRPPGDAPAALDPEHAAEDARLHARTLLELGRYEESVRAFARTPRSAAHLLEEAQLLVGCARWKEARQVLEAYRSAASTPARLATRLELEVSIGLDEGRAALSSRKGELSTSALAILEAKLAHASGGDAVMPLRRLAKTRPKDADVALALARLHLERAELAEAILALQGTEAAPPDLGPALLALQKHDAEPARRLPRSWKLSVGRCLARLARRELDFARQTEDPRYEVAPNATPSQERHERAERYLSFLRIELDGEALGPDLSWRSSATEQLRRAQESRARGDYAESLDALEAWAKSDAYDLGSYEEFTRLTRELEMALPKAEDRLRALHPPYDWGGQFRDAAGGVRVDPASSLRGCVLVVSRAPHLHYELNELLFAFSRSNKFVGSEQTLASVSEQLTGSTWLDQLARATLLAHATQFEEGPPTTVELDRVLEAYPGIVFARVLRALLNVRAGRTEAAREDLAVVREVYPDDQLRTAFVNLLLLAKEGAPQQDVTAALRRVRAKGFRIPEGWRNEDYPELAPALEDPEFRRLLKSGARGRGSRRAEPDVH